MSHLRRRLNNERFDGDCPEDSIYHCNDPTRIMDDPTVACNYDSCRWSLGRLDPDLPPVICRSITIVDPDSLPDYLEPCLWWEMLFGGMQPTAAPSTSPAPTTGKFPGCVFSG